MLGLYDSPSANSINGTGKLNDNPNPSFSLSTKIICYAIIQKKKKMERFIRHIENEMKKCIFLMETCVGKFNLSSLTKILLRIKIFLYFKFFQIRVFKRRLFRRCANLFVSFA